MESLAEWLWLGSYRFALATDHNSGNGYQRQSFVLAAHRHRRDLDHDGLRYFESTDPKLFGRSPGDIGHVFESQRRCRLHAGLVRPLRLQRTDNSDLFGGHGRLEPEDFVCRGRFSSQRHNALVWKNGAEQTDLAKGNYETQIGSTVDSRSFSQRTGAASKTPRQLRGSAAIGDKRRSRAGLHHHWRGA